MFRTPWTAVAVAVLCLLPCSPEDGVVRRYVATVDGRDIRIVEGEDVVVPCTHVADKTHVIHVVQAPTFLYRTSAFSFEFDPSMQLVVDRSDETGQTQVTCSHPDGVHFVVTRWDRLVKAADVNDLADEIAAEMENDDTEVTRKVADPRPIGAEGVIGIVVHAEGDGVLEDHWIGWSNKDGHGYVFEMLAPADRGMLAGRLFGLVQRSFEFIAALESRPESAPASKPVEDGN